MSKQSDQRSSEAFELGDHELDAVVGGMTITKVFDLQTPPLYRDSLAEGQVKSGKPAA